MSAPASPVVVARRGPILVTGGAGFIGSNLVDRLAGDGHDVIVFDALSRAGVADNLAWLQARHGRRITPVVADVRDRDALASAASDASAVFHLAAQVAVTTSLDDPLADADINIRGTLALLEAVRRRATPVPLVFASTNKVYGGLDDVPLAVSDGAYRPDHPAIAANGIGEDRPLDFHTPYGCSKGAADQYVLDYARTFGVPATVLRMSCIYGPRQCGTEDQGWVAHFLIQALRGAPITIFGDGRQVRDLLAVEDAVATYLAAWQRIGTVAGKAFNLGGGPANAASLLQVLDEIERLIGRRPDIRFEGWRPADQRWYVSDARRIRALLDLGDPMPWRMGLARLHRWLSETARAPAAEAIA